MKKILFLIVCLFALNSTFSFASAKGSDGKKPEGKNSASQAGSARAVNHAGSAAAPANLSPQQRVAIEQSLILAYVAKMQDKMPTAAKELLDVNGVQYVANFSPRSLLAVALTITPLTPADDFPLETPTPRGHKSVVKCNYGSYAHKNFHVNN